MDFMKTYEEWLNNPYFDESTKEELRKIKDDENEIKERFYKNLEFGTAGLRGIIGAGTNRLNIYTIRKATQGLANYILKQEGEKRVVIAYDSRHMSPEFAKEAALCLAANGIKAFVFESLRPTPELSFAVRELGCMAGINITASHNPSDYNGYKVYWADGAQITPPHDSGIMQEVNDIIDYSTMKTTTQAKAKAEGLYEVIGDEIDTKYINTIKEYVIHPEAIKEAGDQIKIVYSPLHGTGNMPVRRVLKELGFTKVYVVKEQEMPDGNFPTVPYPNPEAKEAFALGLKLAKEIDADIVLATDPDADRLGVYVKDTKSGEYKVLNGNVSGAFLAEYEIGQRKATKGLPEDGYLVRTIVTTKMSDAIAKYYGLDFHEVLTGFKYIGQKILESENTGKGHYLFGFEESYGCLIGDYARDKDAVSATMALCEAAAYYHTKGMTIYDAIIEMNERYGFYIEDTHAVTLSGIEGLEKISSIMESLRKMPPTSFGALTVLKVRDYQNEIITDLKTKETAKTKLPKSNVLYYELENNAWVCVRPSGTEPKIKFYFGIMEKAQKDAQNSAKVMEEEIKKLLGKLL
ncbi:MAG TPA: phospho-sugar mutase [Candidatus Dorea intestinavium]|nr:phospho-sugar mutase [Candidatus Dorea intestinavium]